MIPPSSIPNVEFYGVELSADTLAVGIGLGFLVVASLIMGLMKVRYAVRIATAEGEKNVLVSGRKEYIEQIVEGPQSRFSFILNFIEFDGKRGSLLGAGTRTRSGPP